jgi:hypothetical protein
MVLSARWTASKLQLHDDRRFLVAMGVVALVLLQVADFAIGRLLRSLTFAEQIAVFATPKGLVYAVLLAAFAAMPVLNRYFRSVQA